MLKDELGLEWSNASISTDDQASSSISSLGKKRVRQAKQFGYLGDISSSPLLYLSLGELVQLIFSEAYWKLFAEYFPGKKDTMRLKLDEIITIRNSLAHFRPIQVDDVEVIRQNAKHALMGIEQYLSSVTQCSSTVPSNSTDEWYKELKPLGSEHYALELRESSGGEWLSVRLNCRPPVLELALTDGWLDGRVININTASILAVAPQIRPRLIFLTESKFIHVVRDSDLRYTKTLDFVFSRKAMEANHKEIAEGFKAAILKLSEETDLLKSDDLARGAVLSPQTIYGWKVGDESPRWSIQSEELASLPKENDPSEYWGDMGWLGSDFVTARHKYPWMGAIVSTSGWG